MKLNFKYSLVYDRESLRIIVSGAVGNTIQTPHKIEQFKTLERMNAFIKLKNLVE